jgi:serine/threonine-protein kinase
MDAASARCPSCAAEAPPGSIYCPTCGEPVSLESASQLPTNIASPSVAKAARRPASSSRVGRLASSDSIHVGGFTPGTILAERYRIIGLLGRGGMGEVYRADDLKLGQPVALKFLPHALAGEKGRLDRFYAEVRIARQVSHPNVCRVYDVGEIDGQQYLSMEYVDGEDLASLLKRIGRLPPDKALEISRELCAGLAAAHDRGVLHRDLKPSNVMIDGRGRARITDFGLAVAAGEVAEGDVSGTPAYMAPEQLAGRSASVQSDVYALGLVLYELSTGRKAFDGATLQELRRKHTEDPPTAPSSLAPGFDPAVERAILRCLEKDPAARPPSAAKVAAALPGGDPLAAALAAGETPSPEMVAAAGERGVISPATARHLLLALAAAVALAAAFTPKANIASYVGLDKSPAVLREHAREILRGAGLEAKPADFANWFITDERFVNWSAARGALGGDISRDAVGFAYRQSPLPLAPEDAWTGPFPGPQVTELDPPPVITGMAQVVLDPRGRLVWLAVVPPEREGEEAAATEADWSALFREAGLDPGRFTPVDPRWTPPTFATGRAAWEGPHPEIPGVTMRVEAASFRGRPVSFRWIGPWAPDSDAGRFDTQAGDLVWEGLLLLFIISGSLIARQNVKAGRGDRRGAVRLAGAVWFVQLAMWAVGAHHVASSLEGWIFLQAASNAMAMAVFIWVIYLALEPFARRRWPQMLISWTRALSGHWRDPLVGRDVLIGAIVGISAGLIMGPLRVLLPPKLGLVGPAPHPFDLTGTANPGAAIGWLLSNALVSLVVVLGIVLVLVLTRAVVKREWLAALVVTLIFAGNYLGNPAAGVTLPLGFLSVGILVVLTVRFGILPALVAETCRRIFGYRIFTNDSSSWYFYAGMIAVAGLLVLAIWATRSALGGRSLFGSWELGGEKG